MELLEMNFDSINLVFWAAPGENSPSYSWSDVTNMLLFLENSEADIVIKGDMSYEKAVETIIADGHTIVGPTE